MQVAGPCLITQCNHGACMGTTTYYDKSINIVVLKHRYAIITLLGKHGYNALVVSDDSVIVPTVVKFRRTRSYIPPFPIDEMVNKVIEGVGIRDGFEELKSWSDKLIRSKPGCHEGVNRYRILEWDKPFVMSGWYGCRACDQPVPNWREVWRWQCLRGYAMLGISNFTDVPPNRKKWAAAFILGLSSSPQEWENRDDTAVPWQKGWRYTDCDDSTMDVVSMFNALKRFSADELCTRPVARCLLANFDKAVAVSGFIKSDEPGTEGGHMWCQLVSKTGKLPINVETTYPVYMGTPIALPHHSGCNFYKDCVERYVDPVVTRNEPHYTDVVACNPCSAMTPWWVTGLSHRTENLHMLVITVGTDDMGPNTVWIRTNPPPTWIVKYTIGPDSIYLVNEKSVTNKNSLIRNAKS